MGSPFGPSQKFWTSSSFIMNPYPPSSRAWLWQKGKTGKWVDNKMGGKLVFQKDRRNIVLIQEVKISKAAKARRSAECK
jgi:hypothetical protein